MKVNQSLKLKLSTTLFGLLFVFGFSQYAHAAYYYQDDISATASQFGGSPQFYLEYLGTGLTGVPTQIRYYTQSSYASSTIGADVFICPSSRATSSPPTASGNTCPYVYAYGQYVVGANTPAYYTFNISSTTSTLNGNEVYLDLQIPAGNGVTGTAYGSSDPNSVPYGTCETINNGGNSVNTWGSCGSIKDLEFDFSTDGGLPPSQSSSSQIVSFSPADGTTTASTTVTFNYQAYINPNDIGFFLGKQMIFYVQQQPIGTAKYFLDKVQATTSGYFNYSTTAVMAPGNYILNACLEDSELGGLVGGFDSLNPWSNSCQYHQFVVGTSTFVGNLFQSGVSTVQSEVNNLTATSSAAILGSYCNPFSGFDIVQCFYALLIPTSGQLQDTMGNFYSDFLTRMPWGYGSVAVADLLGYGNTATTTLSSSNLTIVLPNTGVFATATSTSGLKGKSMTLIDWTQISSTTVQNYWAPALSPLNNFLNMMMGGCFAFWLYFFFKKMRP